MMSGDNENKVSETSIASPDIVRSQASAVHAHIAQGPVQRRVVLDGYVLREFDNDPWA